MEVIMDLDYKIFKLKSGEELIGMIDSQDDMTIKISRPMIVKSVLMVDNSGYPKEVMIMRNWLELTDDLDVQLPKDHIATTLNPAKETVFLYEKQKMREDEEYLFKQMASDLTPKLPPDLGMSGINPHMMNMIQKKMEEELLGKKDSKEEDTSTPESPDKKPNMVGMFLFFPSDVIADLIDTGVLDPEMFAEMMDDGDLLIPEMERMSEKELKEFDLSDWPDDPTKLFQDNNEDNSEEDSEGT
jgi:hypothetical protein